MSQPGVSSAARASQVHLPKGAFLQQPGLLVLLVVAIFINYIDRGNLSVAAPDITRDLSLSPDQMGLLMSAFFWTYASFQLVAGWLIDRYDVRWVYGIGFLIWTISTALTGVVGSFGVLFILRLLLGMGESVAYPACSKIIVLNYPEHQRGKANSFIDAGSKMGPALGTLIGGLIVAEWGWRSLFLLLGTGGLLWLPFWFGYKSKPTGYTAQPRAENAGAIPGLLEIARLRSAWGTFFGLFSLNYVWYFLLSWLPYYLVRERHFSLSMMAVFGSLPFWGLAASSLFGGWSSDRLIAKGGSPTRVRKSYLVVGMLSCTLLLPAAMVENAMVSMAIIVVVCLSFGLATSNLWAITQTIAGPVAAGKWTGMENAFGNLGGVVAPYLTGLVVAQTHSFYLAFVVTALMGVAGAISFGLVVGKVEQHKWIARARQ